MKRIILFFISCLLPPLSFAVGTTAEISFAPVTEYTDNSTIPGNDILKYTVKWADGKLDSIAPRACYSSKLCIDVPVPCGDRHFAVTVTTKPTAKYPGESAPSPTNPIPYASGVTCGPKSVTGVGVS